MASENRVAKLRVNLEKILGSQWTTARELAHLVGRILSMSIALGPASRLWTRAMYSGIDKRCSWETHIQAAWRRDPKEAPVLGRFLRFSTWAAAAVSQPPLLRFELRCERVKVGRTCERRWSGTCGAWGMARRGCTQELDMVGVKSDIMGGTSVLWSRAGSKLLDAHRQSGSSAYPSEGWLSLPPSGGGAGTVRALPAVGSPP